MATESPHYSGDKQVDWKEEGGRAIMKPRGLSITWGNHKRYWRIPKSDQPVSLSRRWNSDSPVFIMARRGDGHSVARKVIFEGRSLHEEFDIPDKFCVKFSPQDSSDSESYLHIGLYDVWNSNWKSGLNIHHAFAREVKETDQKE
ncbi:hypothetical protein LguiA_005234 [Lonicera macranthoides]